MKGDHFNWKGSKSVVKNMMYFQSLSFGNRNFEIFIQEYFIIM